MFGKFALISPERKIRSEERVEIATLSNSNRQKIIGATSMKLHIISRLIAMVGLMVAGRATGDTLADESLPPPPAPVRHTTAVHPTIPIVSPGEVSATPEMWFYEQALASYDNPKYAIRAAAEQRANQRRARMAAMEWYGYSNSRPLWGIDPVHGYLNPQWVGNGYDPFSWVRPPTRR